jgi:molybdate transport system substrate-binding protein
MKRLRPLLLTLSLFSAVALSAADITVFAAASLSDALKEIAQNYEASSGDKLKFNLAASSVLARQIKEGAPADLFFSADEAKMTDLDQADLVVAGSRRSLLGNTLVIVTPKDSALAIGSATDLTSSAVAKLALAEPQTVPAGIYAKAWLEQLDLWEQISAKVIPTENVRACLAAVESANVDAGIVYKTDALISTKVRIACEVPAKDGPRISYPVALIKGSKQPAAAEHFLAYLLSADAKTIFEKYGFILLP